MMLSKTLARRPGGVTVTFHKDWDGTIHIETAQDVEPILERNKALQTFNDGYTKSRDLARVASIPVVVIYEWMRRYGINVFDPAHEAKVRKLLNDPEWRYLRTSSIHL